VSITSFLHAVKRRPSITAPILAQGCVLMLVFTDRPHAAAFLAMFGIAWLAILIALAGDRIIRVRGERDSAHQRITDLETELAEANTDPVTGLPVRRLAERHLDAAGGVELSIAVADVDDMHGINNRHDHQFGDDYLAAIADRLDGLAEDGDMVARLGGDEFVIVTTRGPLVLAHALTAAMRRPLTIRGTEVPVRLSIGICHLDSGDAHTGLGRADLAMYTAKRRRSGIEHYEPARDGVPQPRGVRPPVRHRDRRSSTSPIGGRRSPTTRPAGRCSATG
jgi:diguanylate cyclase (GGDEF)-like protein